MKKIIFFLFLLSNLASFSFAGSFNQIIFFGDSLSDNGNLYQLLLHILPKSPPYFNGRFSNGPTWAEDVGKYYYDKSHYTIGYQIYAWGGATAIFHLPTTEFISPTNLELEVNKYLIDSLLRDRSKTLFVIWIGGNDYLFYPDGDANKATQKVVDKISWAIMTLNNYGAKRFLILNLPDLSRVPYAQGRSSANNYHILTVMHNLKLDNAIKQLQSSHPDIKLSFLNTYDLLNDVIDHPEKYNQKYNVNLTNTTQACWSGSYWQKMDVTEKSLSEEIQAAFIAKKQAIPDDVNKETISKFIMQTPSLSYIYKMGRAYVLGDVPCANANEYLFWDSIHPTEVTHKILSQMVVESLGDQLDS